MLHLFPEFSKYQKYYFLLFLVILLGGYPYMFADAYLPMLNLNDGYLYQLLVLFFLLFAAKGFNVYTTIQKVALLQIFGYFVFFALYGAIGSMLNIITLLVSILMCKLIEKKITIELFFKYYNRWILLMAIGGVITFYLALKGTQPLYIFPNSRNQGLIFSWIVGFSNSYIGDTVRYSGFFDEPGAFGYWTIFALVTNQLFVKDKYLEYLLIPLALLSFSFGFMVQVVIYLLLFKINWKKRTSSIIIISLFALVAFSVYKTKDTPYSVFYDASFGRFEKVEVRSGNLELNEVRSDLSDNAKLLFESSPIVGIGPFESQKYGTMIQDNPYETLAIYGILGTLFLYAPYIYLLMASIVTRNREMFCGMVVLIAGFMQRPLNEKLLPIFMMYAILFAYLKMRKMKLRSSN